MAANHEDSLFEEARQDYALAILYQIINFGNFLLIYIYIYIIYIHSLEVLLEWISTRGFQQLYRCFSQRIEVTTVCLT